PSSASGFNTTALAVSNQTKLYGNGQTAGQIALGAGYSGMLFGPGNSQPHKTLCGNKSIDVHALKAQATACTAGQESTSAAGTLTTPAAKAAAHAAAHSAGV